VLHRGGHIAMLNILVYCYFVLLFYYMQVSTTRLVVRNIPTNWDEARLKAAFIAGVKERATKEKPHVKQVACQ
jgi:hypothetical protein